ncbi:MAG: proteophosphoglycan precursor [Rhodobacterales bacterium 32-66-7]|nr:MAG: proteophosphoglycan precursor [Rhodobacterales bacterium 12-65-15]OYX22679.1 MAG: proteophosphoglycan precursor [Rhodobacterales bacterium 32-66-7]
MTRSAPLPDADALATAARAATRKGLPPVHLWNPDFCGDIDMRIARDGTWFYLGTPIGRPALVKLFSQILKREGDDYFLVTPVEKVGIKVEDAPFLATDFEVAGEGESQTVTFTTKTEDVARLDQDHPLQVKIDPESDEPAPYLLVRANLWALIDRKSFLRLVDLCRHHLHEGTMWFGIWSAGQFFPVIPSSDLS